jgi:hypothetical protein
MMREDGDCATEVTFAAAGERVVVCLFVGVGPMPSDDLSARSATRVAMITIWRISVLLKDLDGETNFSIGAVACGRLTPSDAMLGWSLGREGSPPMAADALRAVSVSYVTRSGA